MSPNNYMVMIIMMPVLFVVLIFSVLTELKQDPIISLGIGGFVAILTMFLFGKILPKEESITSEIKDDGQ